MMKMQPNSLSPAQSLSSSEKEIARTKGPQTFAGIPGGHDSKEAFGENYVGVLITPTSFAFLNINYMKL